jgi:hypothetical protein
VGSVRDGMASVGGGVASMGDRWLRWDIFG